MSCYRCGGRGTIIVCVDDICHGSDHCMHGDGDIMCPDCKARDIERDYCLYCGWYYDEAGHCDYGGCDCKPPVEDSPGARG